MWVSKVVARSLHGGIDVDITLKTGVNLLVGINGSGKTSILNLIDWLTRPNVPALATFSFSYAEVHLVDDEGKKRTIRAQQSDSELDIHYEIESVPVGSPFNVKLLRRVDGSESTETLAELHRQYSVLGPERHELATWEALVSTGKAVVVRLDRRISIEDAESLYIDVDPTPRPGRKSPTKDTMQWVIDVSRAAYTKFRTQLLELNDHLKNEVMLTSFEGAPDDAAPLTRLPDVEDVELVEIRLLQQVSTWSKDPVARKKISKHFAWLKGMVTGMSGADDDVRKVVLEVYRGEVRRVSALSAAFRAFEDRSGAAFFPIKRYLDALNHFLADSRKVIGFDETKNTLGFAFSDQTPSMMRSINRLSSGERQILILYTHVAFPPPGGKLFIVDEPELSLHPKWQHDFLTRLEPFLDDDSQLIVATHSPEIVGQYRDRCISLSP